MWLAKAAAAGFADLTVLSRELMSEQLLPLYPVYQDGSLDALFALVAPEERWRLVMRATIRAFKPREGRTAATQDGCQDGAT